MMFQSIHHVALNVTDYDRSREFYVNRLGFEVLGEYVFPSGTRRLDCRQGGTRLEIFCPAVPPEKPTAPVVGDRHLCFFTENIHNAVAELHARGIETEPIRPDPMAGGLMTFFYDPDGLQLELHE